MEKELQKSKIDQFGEALRCGIDGIVKAADIYVSALDDDPRNAEVFRAAFSEWVPCSAWRQFEAVGRKWMHPRLLLGGISDKKKAAVIKKLPYSMQERVFKKERFDLLLDSGDKLSVDITEATPDQVKQIFQDGSVRNLGEQRAFLESTRKKCVGEDIEMMPYAIKDGRVIFRRGCELTKAEVRRILTEM